MSGKKLERTVTYRVCLKCNKNFPSLSVVNRLCSKCAEQNESIHPRAQGLVVRLKDEDYDSQ